MNFLTKLFDRITLKKKCLECKETLRIESRATRLQKDYEERNLGGQELSRSAAGQAGSSRFYQAGHATCTIASFFPFKLAIIGHPLTVGNERPIRSCRPSIFAIYGDGGASRM